MRKILASAFLATAVAFSAAPVAVAQTKAPAKKKAPAAKPAKKPKAPTKGSKNEYDETSLVVVVIIGGVIVLVGGSLIAWRLLRSGGKAKGGSKEEPILPQRRFDWELRMTEPQEAALLRGVQAYRDNGHSLFFNHEEALITHYEPTMLVSLHRLTDAFLSADPTGQSDPVAVVQRILDGFAATEGPGVLHTRSEWYMPPIDNLDHQGFTDVCYDTLTNPEPYVEGSSGSYADENGGYLTVKIDNGGPLNTFCVDLGRVLGPVQEARAQQPSARLADLVRPVLGQMARGEKAGGMWTRGAASPPEVDLVCRMIAAGNPRRR
jgi:hypothetical protein